MRASTSRVRDVASAARWPERVVELGRVWESVRESDSGQEVLSELWTLVNAALARYVRMHASRMCPLSSEDVCDIASDKSLELLRKLDGSVWNPAASSPAQLCSFLSTLARNGVVDHLRSIRRREIGLEALVEPIVSGDRVAESAEVVAERNRFVGALCACVLRLTPRARTIWFFRVFYEMPTKAIASHPEIGLNPPAVDMALARCRSMMRRCMKSMGFEPGDMPPGTFASLWEALRYRREP